MPYFVRHFGSQGIWRADPMSHASLLMCVTYLFHRAESFLKNLISFQLVKKFPAFYGTRRFITAVISARHLSLSWASSIQSISLHHTSWRSSLILSCHLRLGLPSGLFPSGFPTKALYMPLLYPTHATCPAHLILRDFITRIILVGSTYHKTPHYVVFSIPLLPRHS